VADDQPLRSLLEQAAPEPNPGELEVTKVVQGTDTPDDHEFEICVSRIPDGDPLCERSSAKER
jgi:hypothetical protein